MSNFKFKKELESGDILLQKIKGVVVDRLNFNSNNEYSLKLIKTTLRITKDIDPGWKTIGYIAGAVVDGQVHLGLSLVNNSIRDKFDSNFGKNMAIGRALSGKYIIESNKKELRTFNDGFMVTFYEYSLDDTVDYFLERCVNYFKAKGKIK